MAIHLAVDDIKWVCWLIHTGTHTNQWGRLKWPPAITRLTDHFTCGLTSGLVICELRKELVIHDTESPHWDQVSLKTTTTSVDIIFTSRPFLKTAGGIVLGSVAVSAVSAVSADVLPYISVAIKASFLKLGMCNICKNNIAKMFLDFWKILNCSFDRRF